MAVIIGIIAFVVSIVLAAAVRKWINARFDVYYFGFTGWLKHVFTTWLVCFGLVMFVLSLFGYGQ